MGKKLRSSLAVSIFSPTFGRVDMNAEVNVVTPGGAELTKPPISGRTFTTTRRVSIDDSSPDGRMELDAVARFLQDAGNDDTDDAGMAELGLAWVARRATMEVRSPAKARELLTIRTWCSGTGSRWAERRTSITGDHGASIEAAVIWVHLDAETGRPTKWGEGFANTYLESTGGRRVDAKLRHGSSAILESIVKPARLPLPELDPFRGDSIPAPVRRSLDVSAVERVGGARELIEQHLTLRDWRALVARPRAELALPRPLRKVRVGLIGRDPLDGTFDVDLSMQPMPMEREASPAAGVERLGFDGGVVGVEDEPAIVDAAQQDCPTSRLPRRVYRRQHHRVWLGVTGALRIGEPRRELLDGARVHRCEVHPLDLVAHSLIGQIHCSSLAEVR